MITQIHGHEVIALMRECDRTYTRESLREAIIARFGPDARFHTCSAAELTAEGIIDFFAAKGKFMGTPEAFAFNHERVCRH